MLLPYFPNDLHSILSETQDIDIQERMKILLQLFNAIQHLHINNIIHRDIKPENILMDEDMLPYLSDFEHAQFINLTSDEYYPVVGSPCYVAPEVTLFHPYDGKSADIYSLGVTSWAIIFETLPNDGDVTDIYPGDTGKIRDLLIKMVSQDPLARPSIFDARNVLVDEYKIVIAHSHPFYQDPLGRSSPA